MNSKLYDNIIILPETLIKHLEQCFNSVNGDTKTEGYNRNQELRQSKQVTYQNLKRIKNWFETFNGRKEDAPFILNGGDRMYQWVNHALKQMRDSLNTGKKVKKDTGMLNQYIDNHQKDGTDIASQHSRTVDNLKVENEIKRINKLIKLL
jgi:hypothetical protein